MLVVAYYSEQATWYWRWGVINNTTETNRRHANGGAGVPRTLAWCQNGAVAGASVTDKVTDGAGSTVKPGKSAQVREMYETGKKKGGSSFGGNQESNPPSLTPRSPRNHKIYARNFRCEKVML